MPLACDSTVALEASEQCPRTHSLIIEAFAEAPEIVSALIDHPEGRRINFAGSTHMSWIIAKRAAEQPKP
ncbi:hypothetical protein HL653_11600 [Sphingomonas sp. AP4-R1]|uniref:hypothetical protein n=1 Tax=Sphingomonas sp. AP4-R1 TaxID=2735134 RepID=UPI001493DD2E|nr:hypothetical protein HL653_11600 [Sphingomonas sp. AP4-R1]